MGSLLLVKSTTRLKIFSALESSELLLLSRFHFHKTTPLLRRHLSPMSLSFSLKHFPSSSASPPPPPTNNTTSMKINGAIHISRPPYQLPLPTKDNHVALKLNKNTAVDRDFPTTKQPLILETDADDAASRRLVLESLLHAISDRVEMHHNIGEQRTNWNSLLLNSINMMTFTATAMAGISSASVSASGNAPLALNIVSSLLFSAATGMLVVMNKIQPSQLAEEQRNAVRLFKELYNEVKERRERATRDDVEEITRRVLALDRAYPLPLLGVMLDKFPANFEPAVWWPAKGKRGNNSPKQGASSGNQRNCVAGNGWTRELETEMRAILQVLKQKDSEEYKRLGNIVLRTNKMLAIAGPLLTGIAAAASAFMGVGPWTAVAAVAGGALAGAVNIFEHGGQVGMVFEMYRNSAGFLRLLEESIESALEESDCDRRENGERLEMKLAIKLGRSLSQLRDLAAKSIYSAAEGIAAEEFACKLF